ncbi:MAG: Fur family transcriptional regulator [Lacisediminihabitans sp.]
MQTVFEQELRDAGLRVTSGRVALLEALDGRPHSDAETLFRALRETLPGTSIQSVHNVLGDLTSARIIRRIEPAGSPARYERRVDDNHHHLVCTSCGTITDVDCVVGHAPCLVPSDNAGYAVQAAEVTFWGLCGRCQTKEAADHGIRLSTAPQHDPTHNKETP